MTSFIDILKLSFKDAIKGKIWGWLLGGTGSLVGILLLAKNLLNYSVGFSVLVGVVIVASIFLVRWFLFFMKHAYKKLHYLYKESVYGDAIILLRDSFAHIHYLRKKDEIDDVEFMTCMTSFCENLKRIFDKKTKTTCSVSIKVPVKGPMTVDATVKNLCRDGASSKKRDTVAYNSIAHSILGNTAYQMIINKMSNGKKDPLFYSNPDITLNPDYVNTSREAYDNGQLPYRCELVYPITPLISENKTATLDCLGFICIDSDGTNCFDHKYDVAIISGVADGIYDTLTFRNNLNQ